MSTDLNDDTRVIDFGMTQEVTITECSTVERIGPLTRLIFTIPTTIDPPPAKQRRVVVIKLLVPTELIPAIAAQIAGGPARSLPRSSDEVTLQ
jgi:hypothetical protein